MLDFEVPAAKEWIEIAGKDLHQGAVEGRQSWALSREREMGREVKRMSLTRWEFWEERMREYLDQAQVIVDAGKGAGEEMRKLRESGK